MKVFMFLLAAALLTGGALMVRASADTVGNGDLRLGQQQQPKPVEVRKLYASASGLSGLA